MNVINFTPYISEKLHWQIIFLLVIGLMFLDNLHAQSTTITSTKVACIYQGSPTRNYGNDNITYTVNYMDDVPSAQTFSNVNVSNGSATISGLSAGIYNDLTITVSGCTSIEDVDIVLVDPSPPTALIAPANVCLGSMNTIVANPLNGSGTYSTHLWTDLGTGTATGYALSNTNAQTLSIDATGTTGTINLQYTVTDDANCSATVNHTITIIETNTVTLCDDGSNSATFTAQAGLTNIVWYNSADIPVGSGTNLTVNISTAGLEDGTESFYYTASEGTGCSIGLCCPVLVMLESCIYDFGDLPDLTSATATGDYQTTLSNDGPRHRIVSGLILGATIDDEMDGQQSVLADGDDTDEDGFTFPNTLAIHSGGTIIRPLDITNTTGTVAHLEGWIDWNGDGDFNEMDEMIIDISDDGNGDFGVNSISIPVPTTTVLDQSIGVRFRLSHTDNMTPYGVLTSGEVEDYLIQVSCPTSDCLPVRITIIRGGE